MWIGTLELYGPRVQEACPATRSSKRPLGVHRCLISEGNCEGHSEKALGGKTLCDIVTLVRRDNVWHCHTILLREV